MTKVILIKDVSGLGQIDDIKEVKSGYFRNFLYPQGLAVEATSKTLEAAEERAKKREEEKKLAEDLLAKTVEGLKDKTLKVVKKADDTGSLFDKLDKKELTGLIKEQLRFDVPEDIIKLEEPFKKIGSYEVEVGDSKLKVEITQEDTKKTE